ncbi:MAG: hypothetical protein FJ301_10070 [Planctomycetes bacterium]|nr:hypothetical protein [Planctomycetota bacterium]
MQLLADDNEPAFTVAYRTAPGGADRELRVHRVAVTGLPPGVQALFVTSDLQGYTDGPRGPELAGFAVAAAMARHAAERGIARERVGVLLAGDLYAGADAQHRAIVGDVRPVWRAFAQRAAFVAGVAGNHDAFGATVDEVRAFAAEPGVALLDPGIHGLAVAVEFAGLRIAGVSGIVGSPNRPWRRRHDDYIDAVAAAIGAQPDVLLLHQNPALPGVRRDELSRLTQVLAAAGSGVVVFGHAFSPAPRFALGRCQVLATEGRAFWLEAVDGVGGAPAVGGGNGVG